MEKITKLCFSVVGKGAQAQILKENNWSDNKSQINTASSKALSCQHSPNNQEKQAHTLPNTFRDRCH